MLVISKRPKRTPLGVIEKSLSDDRRKWLIAEAALTAWLNGAYKTLGLTKDEMHSTILNYISNGQLNPLLDALNWVEFGRQFNGLTDQLSGLNYDRAKLTVGQFFKDPSILSGNLANSPAVLSGMVTTGTLNTSLTMIDQQALTWAQDHSAALVTNISAEIRQNINHLVTESISGDFTVDSLARQIKMIVPLTDRYAGAVMKRQNMLLDGFLKGGMDLSEAKDRALSMSETYADKLTASRAQNIARTEVMTAVGQGRLNAWGTMMQQGIMPQDAQKIWMTAEDERVCPICGDLDGETVPMYSTFSTGVMTIPAHNSCRCDVSYLPSETPEGNPYDQGNPDGSPISSDNTDNVDSTDQTDGEVVDG